MKNNLHKFIRSPFQARYLRKSGKRRSIRLINVSEACLLGLLFIAIAVTNVRAESSASSNQPKKQVKSTVLFMNWGSVFKGSMHPTIDPSRVSENGKKAIEGLQNSWNVVFKTNGHGLEPYQTPKGIHISVEKARKEPFELKADRPWEERIHGPTILEDGGRLRCWYTVSMPAQNQEIVFQEKRAIETRGQALCYAESEDGVTWTKPNLGIHSFEGSKDNNIVSFAHFIAAVFRDENGSPEALSSRSCHQRNWPRATAETFIPIVSTVWSRLMATTGNRSRRLLSDTFAIHKT